MRQQTTKVAEKGFNTKNLILQHDGVCKTKEKAKCIYHEQTELL